MSQIVSLSFCNEDYEEIHFVKISQKEFEEIWVGLKYGTHEFPFAYGIDHQKWIEEEERVKNLFYHLVNIGAATIGCMQIAKYFKKVRVNVSD